MTGEGGANLAKNSVTYFMDGPFKPIKPVKCNMSLTIHFLISHLDFFSANFGSVKDEQGERFHQAIPSEDGKRSNGYWNPLMSHDCHRTLREGAGVDVEYKPKAAKTELSSNGIMSAPVKVTVNAQTDAFASVKHVQNVHI